MKERLLLFFTIISLSISAQTSPASATPKLVVGLVVDQMRWDFFYRYPTKYSENGFKRLLREGYKCENTHINYSPSYTAPGHASIYTGSVPNVNGITGNYWYDYDAGKVVYCTEDTTRKTVGAAGKAGLMSPVRMQSTSIADEMKLSSNFISKTIGIALKDRGAILPAGHSANAAYFYDGASGNWITSSYYMDTLPAWATAFNDKKLAATYVSGNWNTLLPLAQYFESHDDDVPFESAFRNEAKPVFEHKVSELAKPGLDIIRATPFGNSFTLDFAKAAIENEKLGMGKNTDMLAISLSSTDYIGHQFGPNSVEAEDCYLRLDKDIESFLNFLDAKIGKGNYLLFLTADHGAAHAPGFLQSKKIPAGSLNTDTLVDQLNRILQTKMGAGEWILTFDNMQFYLNKELIADSAADVEEIKEIIISYCLKQDGVADALDMQEIEESTLNADMKSKIINGYYPGRSGDIFLLTKPGWVEGFAKGTTHGTIYPYDTHIPLLFMGWKVKPASDYTPVYITDIAPTIAAMVKCQEPNGSVGKVITGVLK
ncbi:MAG: alkaline phosphatase family protein [Bacteroidetes bacterium]|nr:alkaline phosphatase family protein [Bacteroidota bacterium]